MSYLNSLGPHTAPAHEFRKCEMVDHQQVRLRTSRATSKLIKKNMWNSAASDVIINKAVILWIIPEKGSFRQERKSSSTGNHQAWSQIELLLQWVISKRATKVVFRRFRFKRFVVSIKREITQRDSRNIFLNKKMILGEFVLFTEESDVRL